MNLRRIATPVSAILLTVGLLTVGAPANASTTKPPANHTSDTGWGYK